MSLSHQPQPTPTTPNSETSSPSVVPDPHPVIVPLFESTAYLGFEEWPVERTAACVHACEMHHPQAGRLTAYAKMYPAAGTVSRGLLNEISAYILGRVLGVPMADYAFVCFIPLNKLDTPPIRHRWITSMLKENKLADYPAFCTSKIEGGDAVINYASVGPKLFAEDLRQWPGLPLAARFDQHITNTDRHLGNLRRVSKHSYRLFDQGRLVTEVGDWQSADLVQMEKHKFPDKLLEKAWPDHRPHQTVSEILLHLGYHVTAMTLAMPELRWWWSRLAQPDDAAGFEQYLVNRAKELKRMYESEYNLLSL